MPAAVATGERPSSRPRRPGARRSISCSRSNPDREVWPDLHQPVSRPPRTAKLDGRAHLGGTGDSRTAPPVSANGSPTPTPTAILGTTTGPGTKSSSNVATYRKYQREGRFFACSAVVLRELGWCAGEPVLDVALSSLTGQMTSALRHPSTAVAAVITSKSPRRGRDASNSGLISRMGH
jgi:hypothetical protein